MAAISGRIVTEFLQRTNISVATWKPDPSSNKTQQRVREKVTTWDLGDISPQRCERHIVTAINLAITTYGHTHPDVQVHIALFTTLALCIDDLEIKPEALEQFVQRMNKNTPQLHPVLDYLVDNLQEFSKFFPPYAASAIFTATIQGINSTLFEQQKGKITLTAHSLPYVLYKRARNGVGEAYGFFAWDIFSFPDVSVYIQIIS